REVGADPKIPLAVIVDLNALFVQSKLSSDQVAYAKPGTPIVLKFSEIPNKPVEGSVSRITTQVASQLGGLRKEEQYLAMIGFKNENGAVRPGMKPIAAIKTGEVKSALAVPNDAVGKDSSGRPIVKVLHAGKWDPVVVETGLSDGQYT